MAIEGKARSGEGPGGGCGSAWSAAARAPSSAPCTASRRAWTTATSWSRARSSSDPERAKASAAELRIAPERAYGSFQEMAEQGGGAGRRHRRRGDRHAEPRPLRRGQGVPRGRHPRDLRQAADHHGRRRAGSGSDGAAHRPGVRPDPQLHRLIRWCAQARARVAAGELGRIRVVQVEYPQDWLTTRLEATGQKQAAWRTDPAQSGAGGAIGDIGSHAYNLAALHHRPGARAAVRRSHDLRRGPPGRRQLQHPAALRRRRARHALGEPGRARQREQPEDPGLRRQGRARVAPGAPRSAAGVPVRPAAAA